MTVAAREVLEDCRAALAELADGIQGREWRVRWVLAVVLLRAVGHVLSKVDGTSSDAMGQAVSRWWAQLNGTRPEPAIFWQFIEEERNSILKEYRTNAGQGVTVQLQGMEIRVLIAGEAIRGDIEVTEDPAIVVHHYKMNDGAFKGQDQRDLVSTAILWWQEQLDKIENSVGSP